MGNKMIEENIDKLYKHIEYPSMPFAIDDTVYYIEKVSERGGLPGYKIIKCILSYKKKLSISIIILFKRFTKFFLDVII